MSLPADGKGLARRIRGSVGSEPRALARALSWIENRDDRRDELLSELAAGDDPSVPPVRLGFTGAPGVGKSSLVARLVPGLRGGDAPEPVAVLAVDPTSPVTGGALLGDRARMDRHQGDDGVFIRSLASRRGRGGLARGTDECAFVLERAGFGVVLIETVGVGQLEMEIVDTADRVHLLVSPESGDGLQFLKAGMLEVVHGVVVNKVDRPGAERMLQLAEELAHERELPAPVGVSCETDEGIEDLLDRLRADLREVREQGADRERSRWIRRLGRRVEETWLERRWQAVGGRDALEPLADALHAGELSWLEALHRLEDET